MLYKTIKEQEQKPARKQVGEDVLRNLGALRGEMEAGSTYNMWYNRWTGHRTSFSEPAQHKIDPVRDVGLTRGSADKSSSFCLFFARGCCPHGVQCRFWHRIPTPEDKEDIPVDLFGRERYADFRDDMGGTGAFGRENRTLYVGRVAPYPEAEDIVTKFFEPYGEILKVNVLRSKGVAFVEFSRRIYAEFAKEAMSNQKLERKEILNVRWATEDPNPNARADAKREAEERVYQTLIKKLPAEYANAQLEYYGEEPNNGSEVPEGEEEASNKRLRLTGSNDYTDKVDEAAVSLEDPLEVLPAFPEKKEAASSFISPEVLQSIGYIGQYINATKAYLESPTTVSATATKAKESASSSLSLLGETYASDSDEE